MRERVLMLEFFVLAAFVNKAVSPSRDVSIRITIGPIWMGTSLRAWGGITQRKHYYNEG